MPSIYANLSPSSSLSIDPHLCMPLCCNKTHRSPLRIAAHRQSLTAFMPHTYMNTARPTRSTPLHPTSIPLLAGALVSHLAQIFDNNFAPTHLSIHLQLLNLVSFVANYFKSMLGSRKPVNLCKSFGYSGAVQLVATGNPTPNPNPKPKLIPNNALKKPRTC